MIKVIIALVWPCITHETFSKYLENLNTARKAFSLPRAVLERNIPLKFALYGHKIIVMKFINKISNT